MWDKRRVFDQLNGPFHKDAGNRINFWEKVLEAELHSIEESYAWRDVEIVVAPVLCDWMALSLANAFRWACSRVAYTAKTRMMSRLF